MKRMVITILRWLMNVFYAVCKWFPVRRKVVMMSREFDTEPLDFVLLREEIKRRDASVTVVSLCKTVPKGTALIGYAAHMLMCMAHLATASVCVVDTYCLPVSLLKHRKSLTVIQIWHALGAIKRFGYQSLGLEEGRNRCTAEWLRMHRGYTKVLCPSRATAPFYQEAFDVSPDTIHVGGMPRIDWLLSDQTALKERVLLDYPMLQDKPVVLYAPTFRKGKPSAHDALIQHIDHDAYHLIVSAHPISNEQVDSRYTVTGYSSSELLAVADIVITDYSAIAFEAALQRKKLYFFLYDLEEYRHSRGLNILPTDVLPACCAVDADTLVGLLNQPYDFKALESFCQTYIETADTHNTARLVDYIESRLAR